MRNAANETQLEESPVRSNNNSVMVKRTASISSPRTHQDSSAEIVKATATTECSAATQTEAKSPLQQQQQQQQQLQREESFVRTGSGRKLPKIPSKETAAGENDNAAVRMREASTDREEKLENRKSKPKALEFWESLINPSKNPVAVSMEHIDDEDDPDFMEEDDLGPPDDFRYNTIHRMSMGRRMLPRPPGGTTATAAQRSQSLDRNGELAFRGDKAENDRASFLNARY